jgi:hypothetical protein
VIVYGTLRGAGATALPTRKRRLAGEPSRAKKLEALVAIDATLRLRLNPGGPAKRAARRETG